MSFLTSQLLTSVRGFRWLTSRLRGSQSRASQWRLPGAVLSVWCLAGAAWADAFTVMDIRIDGLQRIPAAKVYAVLPINVGDKVDEPVIANAIRAVFGSGNFDDVHISREGDKLVVEVVERPVISEITLKGNKSIDKDNLLKGLEQAGLAEGQVYQRSTIEHIRQELERQYIAQGRYGAKIDVKENPRTRNRVALNVDIHEGEVAAIRAIRFIGNKAFSDEHLKELLSLKERHFWSFIQRDNKYSREKLAADLEVLKSWYMDRGYAAFAIASTQVTVSPDLSGVFVTLVLSEGDRYKVGDIKLAGDMPVPEEDLRKLVLVKSGDVFSQQRLEVSSKLIRQRLASEGYVFAEVQPVPDVDAQTKLAAITLFVNPQKRTYVRRVSFQGNSNTSDEVMRREMRQFEGAVAQDDRIELSRMRLQRLGFFSDVKAEKTPVPGVSDQIDLNFKVTEQPSGSVGANIGYSQGSGVMFGANVSQNNFMGTGNKVSFAINQSEVRDSANFSFVNPYFTPDGVSRGFSLYYRKTDYSSTEISNYLTNSYGATVNFGYPVNENERLNFGFGYDNTNIVHGVLAAALIKEFVANEGDQFDTFTSTLSWNRSTLNKGVFPDRGASQNIGIELAIPGSDVNYYKLSYSAQRYWPLIAEGWALRARTDLGYGEGYGDSGRLPFYKNYFSGGFGSVRGFRDNSLGPLSPAFDGDTQPDPVGGNVQIETGLELIFPIPFVKSAPSVRTLLFLDGGNVFDTHDSQYPVDLSQLRYSAGVGLSWLTAIGPLTFSLSRILQSEPADRTQNFQFSIGQTF